MANASTRPLSSVAQTMSKARALLAEGQAVSAELILRTLVEREPSVFDAWLLLADLAEQRGDGERARHCLTEATVQAPQDNALALAVAHKQLVAGYVDATIDTLSLVIEREPNSVVAWVMLGDALDLVDMHELAMRARHQGVLRGQRSGQLLDMPSTPPVLHPVIHSIINEVNHQRSSRITDTLARMREQFGADALKRVEHTMAVYLEQIQDAPPSPHQQPKFMFFPGLPPGPYHDPHLHPWTAKLVAAFDDIRAEAQAVLDTEGALQTFLTFKKGQNVDEYVGGDGKNRSWDAFFFYRHGKRIDEHHAMCPKTSALLESIERCEVDGQAPEICFSVLQPGTRIMPHHGVTNTRVVLHLPLIVPGDCALLVHGGGEHVWKEREPMMFDDTYLHEAWNRSDELRVVLLLDCWNPHLTAEERVAVRHLTEAISAYETFPTGDLRNLADLVRSRAAAAPVVE